MGTLKPDTRAQLKAIIEKYIAGKASPEEQQFLEAYFEHFETGDAIVDQLSASERAQLEQKMEAAIFTKIKHRPPVRKINYHRLAAAAVFIGIILTAGIYFYSRPGNRGVETARQQHQQPEPLNDLDPGGNKAILILADGRRIDLDDSRSGTITQQGNAVVSKTSEGQVVYNRLSQETTTGITNNTIQTPIGGEYQVTLSDGTRVWLNSGSRLEFPAAFAGKERVVSLSGEGYFEVAKNTAMPFKVKVNDMEVKVLGTHFNIMAYGDEALVKTTLVEGAVNITKGAARKILKPGQQARTGTDEKIDVVKADVESAVAWKNGYFKFNKDGIQAVMRQLARWYDMEVVYRGAAPKDEFTGKIRRNVKASKALEFLEQTGLQFRIEGKKVTVL